MKEKLENIKKEAVEGLEKASTIEELEKLRVKYLGRKGPLTQLLRNLKDVSPEERPLIGKMANSIKESLEESFSRKLNLIRKRERKIDLSQGEDITLPGRRPQMGTIHPITQLSNEIIDIFLKMGFFLAEGPEIETEYYNFEALNTPPDHPVRDTQDSFYLAEKTILRTQTSPVQIRVMEKFKPPVRIVSAGRCFRRDATDASHTPMFHQMEVFQVDKGITFAHLKGVLEVFVQSFFGRKTKLRFRPSFFPFTEPSAEIDISCVICQGKGCPVCRKKGWLEILGSGMIDPFVLKTVGYDPEKVSGYAFGMGIERIAMLKYGIDDIRLFFENDLRFLRQF